MLRHDRLRVGTGLGASPPARALRKKTGAAL
jgi:hypothetical protein